MLLLLTMKQVRVFVQAGLVPIGRVINISLPAVLSPARDASDATAPQKPIHRRKSLSNRVKSDWDSLLWVFAAFAVFYFTNFASTLVFNESVNG